MEQQAAAPVIVQIPTPLFAEIVEVIGSIRPNREIGPIYDSVLKIAARANKNGVFDATTPVTVQEFQGIEQFLSDREPKYVHAVMGKLVAFVTEYNEAKRLEAEAAQQAAEAAQAAANATDPAVVTDAPVKSADPVAV